MLESEYIVSDEVLPVEDGTIDVRVLTPTGGSDYPVFVWYHGSGTSMTIACQYTRELTSSLRRLSCAGWLVGDVDIDDYHLRTICVELQLAIVNVGYR